MFGANTPLVSMAEVCSEPEPEGSQKRPKRGRKVSEAGTAEAIWIGTLAGGCSEQQRSAVIGLHRRNGGSPSERGEAAEDRAIGNVSSVETVVAGPGCVVMMRSYEVARLPRSERRRKLGG